MIERTVPASEPDRLASLRSANLLDANPEERFDRITRIAAQLLGVPHARIWMVGNDRCWVKSQVGPELPAEPFSQALCVQGVMANGSLLIEDARLVPQVVASPLITEGDIRFYAAEPLRTTHGIAVGMLAILDSEPRTLTVHERQLLRSLADWAEHEVSAHHLKRALGDRDRAEAVLRHQYEFYQALLKAQSDLGEGFLVMDDGRIDYANEAFCRISGYELTELLDLPSMNHLVPEELRSAFSDRVSERMADVFGRDYFESAIIEREGRRIELEVALTIADLSDRQKVVVIVRDITKRKQAEEAVKRLAYYDSLTGLPNRVLFLDRLDHSLAHARRTENLIAIMVLDLDRFKLINDTLGHEVGDRIISMIADRLNACVRDCDTVARLEGDEFTIILTDVGDVAGAIRVAKRIIHALSIPFFVEEQELFVTTSIGISVFPNDGDNAADLMKKADAAMYRAKDQRNSYQLYTSNMNVVAAERLSLETSLRKAIEREELLLHYQPKVHLVTGQIVGAEALLRWQHPEHGMVSPGQFIPVAEETGLIVPITEWVVKTACNQLKAWRDEGLPALRMSVNLSGRHFKQEGLVALATEILVSTGVPPEQIEFELTESILMENVEVTIKTLKYLSFMGFQFSIDDFGTGYSSLSYLKRFPINTLKIDRSFVRDMASNQDDAAIVRAIIALARSLNLRLVAEGVETADQLAFLKDHGCDEMQGFYFSKPVPAEALRSLIISGRTLYSEAP